MTIKSTSKPTVFQPAKKGDGILITRTDSYTKISMETVRTTVYCLAEVTTVTRDGRVKTANRPQGCPWPWAFSGSEGGLIVRQSLLSKPFTDILAELGPNADFASITDARAAIIPYLADEQNRALAAAYQASLTA